MKKFMLSIAMLYLFLMTNAYAALPTGTPKGIIAVPSFYGGFVFGLNVNFVMPSTEQLDYALFFPKFDSSLPGGPPIFEDGVYKNVDHDEGIGLEFVIGYVKPCTGNDVMASYSNYDRGDDDRFLNPTGAPTLFATLSSASGNGAFPFSGSNQLFFFDPRFNFGTTGFVNNLAIPAPILAAGASTRFSLDLWDLEFGQSINFGCRDRCRFFGGLRLAELENNLNATYLGVGTLTNVVVTTNTTPGRANFVVLGTLKVDQECVYHGIGPRLGLNNTYHIGNGFGFVTEGSVALLTGKIRSSLRDLLTFDANGIGTAGPVNGMQASDNTVQSEISYGIPDELRVIPNLTLKVAFDYTYQVCFFRRVKVGVELGYIVDQYWNSNDRLSGNVINRDLADTTTDGPSFNRPTLDTSYAGPYFAIQLLL